MLVGPFACEDDLDTMLAGEGGKGELGDGVEVKVMMFAVVCGVGKVVG